MNNNKDLLTLGQASCLALCLPPTKENRKQAKQIFTGSLFEVTYLKDANPLLPVAIGKNVKILNPFLYNSYPETPPLSPAAYSAEEEEVEGIAINNNTGSENDIQQGDTSKSDQYARDFGEYIEAYEGIANLVTDATTSKPAEPSKSHAAAKAYLAPPAKGSVKAYDASAGNRKPNKRKATTALSAAAKPDKSRSPNQAGSSSSAEDGKAVASKKKIMDYLQQVLHTRVPVEKSQYDHLFVTSADQLDLVKEHFDVSLNQKQLARWIGQSDFLSYPITHKGIKGRWLYVLKEAHRDNLQL